MSTLYIDSDTHKHKKKDDLCLHTSQLDWLEYMRKGSFTEIHINNTKATDLTHKKLFHLHRLLVNNGTISILIDQKIGILQELDSEEILSNGKLAGFNNIQVNNFEKFIYDEKSKNDVRLNSLVVTMIKDE